MLLFNDPLKVIFLSFALKTRGTLDNMDGDLGFVWGDFNTTLNPNLHQYGYVTDPQKKGRSPFQQ